MDAASQVNISYATTDDIPHILSMIRELAGHEKAEHLVEATEASLLRTLTFAEGGTHPAHTNPGYAKTLILRLPSTPQHPDDELNAVAGMAMFFNNYSTWRSKPGVYLEDLFVRPQYRKRGYGKLLIRALAQEVLRIEGGRLEWSCLRWNSASLGFYEGLGAKRLEDWVGLRLEGKELEEVAMGKKGKVEAESETVNGH